MVNMASDGLKLGSEMSELSRQDSSEVMNFINPQLASSAYPQFEEIRRQGKLCDITLKVEDVKFSAHRVVLAAVSPYFNAMFTNDMAEANKKEITMQGLEPQALEALINYAYNGRLRIDGNNVHSLLVGGAFLQLNAVKDACCEYLRDKLNPSNCLDIRSFGDQFSCPTLTEATNRYIQLHFVAIVALEDFRHLSYKELHEIIGWDQLYVPSEAEVFEAVMTWVSHDPEKRKCQLPELLKRVRLPLLSPQFLADRVGTHDLIKADLKCRDLLDEARDYHLMPERRQQLQSFKTRPRCCTDVFGVIYAVGGLTSSGDSLSTVECFDPTLEKWQVAEAMSTMRSRVGVAVLKGVLYAIGGYDGQDRLSTVEVFDPDLWKWKRVASMTCKRSAVGAVALEERLFVCGGYDGVSSLNSVECYEPQKNEWTLCKTMQRHRSAAGVCVFDGQIFALGGHDGLSIFDSVECYDPRCQTWSTVTSMTTKRCRLGVAALNGRLYAAGGYDGAVFLKSCEVFDPVTQQWTYIASMNKKRSRVALVTNYGKIYAIGGYDGQANLSSLELFDPETKSWTYGPPMVAHEGGVGVGVVPVSR